MDLATIGHPARRAAVMACIGVLVIGTAVAASVAARSLLADAAAPPACTGGTTVETASGPVCGIVSGQDTQWLGIPYAAPPLGTLRWRPPQPHAPWTTTLAATAFGNECVQPPTPPATAPAVSGSEDCLFLNVIRPTGSLPASGLPVLVHIHGGGFWGQNGNADQSLLADAGHEVVVSMNYRLDIFGFAANRAFGPHSGDYGLQDQQAALRWVQRNIRAFGGNPGNVTIYGESAGGSSVCDQIASPTASGLFQKAVSASGEYNTLSGAPGDPTFFLEPQDCKSTLPTQQQANKLGDSFAAALGCGHAHDVAGCMRNASAADVFNAAGKGYQYGGTGTIAPTLNGVTLTQSPRDTFRRGEENRVKVIAGVARDEDLNGFPSSIQEFHQLVREQFGRYAGRVLMEYPLSNYSSPALAFRTISADSGNVCGALMIDKLLARHVTVYGYEVDDGGLPDPTWLPPHVPSGTYHTADTVWLLPPSAIGSLNENEQILARQQIAEITEFARTGNPNATGTPRWPAFNGAGQIMSWQPGGDSQVMLPEQMSLVHHCRFWNSIAQS